MAGGDNPTEHNDVWVRFADADLFFAQKDGSFAFPKPQPRKFGKGPRPGLARFTE